MSYFEKCYTMQQLKGEYRKLAFDLHPDRGGNHKEFTAMSNEYQKRFEEIKKRFNENNKYKPDDQKINEEPETYRDIIIKIIKDLVKFDLNIEIIGTWIWIDKTEDQKAIDMLEKIGFKFSKGRGKWRLGDDIGYYREKKPMEQIRAEYGSIVIKGNPKDSDNFKSTTKKKPETKKSSSKKQSGQMRLLPAY